MSPDEKREFYNIVWSDIRTGMRSATNWRDMYRAVSEGHRLVEELDREGTGKQNG